jgi:hypothetical protein
MNKFTILVPFLVSALFIGCASSKRQVNLTFEIEEDTQEVAPTVFNNGISIHGMEGAYPKSSKDKQLGHGMLNHKFFDIVKKIQSNLSDIVDNQILIEIKTNDPKPEVTDVVNEAIKYFTLHKDFKVREGDGKLADVVISVKEDNSLKFTIYYQEDSEIFEDDTPVTIDLGMTITEISNESSSAWSKVEVEAGNSSLAPITYEIMKDPVTVSSYNPKFLGDRSVTDIKYSDADDYCAKKYDGYVTPIYVFEYALRKGLINFPTQGVGKEMISGYDSENDADVILFREGDIVQSRSARDDSSDFSEIVIFDYKAQKYTFNRDNFRSKSVTFRCAR